MDRSMSPRGCRWPMWPHGAKPTHEYCGCARRAGSSYCDQHFKKALRDHETEPRQVFVPHRRAA